MAASVCFALGVSYARICLYIFLFMVTGWNKAPWRNPHQGSPHCYTKSISEKHAKQICLFNYTFKECEFKDLLLLLIFWTHDFTDLFIWHMTHSLWVISKKRVICVLCYKQEKLLGVIVSSYAKIRVMWRWQNKGRICALQFSPDTSKSNEQSRMQQTAIEIQKVKGLVAVKCLHEFS